MTVFHFRNDHARLRLGVTVAALLLGSAAAAETTLLNVSYDPTRELYRDINKAFADDWKAKTGEAILVRASHGGSGAQARSVIDGIDADVVTLGIPSDIDAIARLTKKVSADWRTRLPNTALPYTSTAVFLVRKDNPKGIKDWADLIRPGREGHHAQSEDIGRWTLELPRRLGQAFNATKSLEKANNYVKALYANVPVLDTGARGSTVTFAQRSLGDVLPTWENEAFLVFSEFGRDKFDIVVPSTSILAEPPVALVDANVDRKGTRKQAEAYLQFLYTDTAQALFAKHHYRPFKPDGANKDDLASLPAVNLFTIESIQPNWDVIQKTFFDAGGLFDVISKVGK